MSQRIDVVRWLKDRHAPAGRQCRLDVWLHPNDGSICPLRLVTVRLTAQQTAASIKCKKRKAAQGKRQLQPETICLAG